LAHLSPRSSDLNDAHDVRLKHWRLAQLEDAGAVGAMIQAGAQDYVLKEARAAELMAAIRTVAAGGAAIDPSVASQVLEYYRRMAIGAASHMVGQFSERELSLFAPLG